MADLTNKETFMPIAKVWKEQRVVTFKDIDAVHKRPNGTAKRNFNRNRKKFIEGEDYFELNQRDEIRTLGIERPQGGTPNSVILMTESGYLMIVKSFKDDLSWDVQRQLVNTYFKFKDIVDNYSSPELPAQSKSLVPLRKNIGWYYDNREAIDVVCDELNMTYSELYHHILHFIGQKYDLKAARRIYEKELGYRPEMPMDIVEYFPQLAEYATTILESYYRIATT